MVEINIGPMVLDRNCFKNVVNVFSLFCKKGRDPFFEQTLISFTQEFLVPKFVEIGPVIIERKMKSEKFTERQMEGQTDRR